MSIATRTGDDGTTALMYKRRVPKTHPNALRIRACLKIRKGAVFGPQAGWRGATKENIPGGSSTEEQRSQPACGAKTLRAAGLLAVAGVGSVLTARCGDARTSPPWPQPKSLAAAPFPIFRQALQPKLVAEIAFNERTARGHLRHSKFVRLRGDKSAKGGKADV